MPSTTTTTIAMRNNDGKYPMDFVLMSMDGSQSSSVYESYTGRDENWSGQMYTSSASIHTRDLSP